MFTIVNTNRRLPHLCCTRYGCHWEQGKLFHFKLLGFQKVYLELKDHEEYRVYLFSRGWFYTKFYTKGRVEYIEVKRGQVISLELTIQVVLKNRAKL